MPIARRANPLAANPRPARPRFAGAVLFDFDGVLVDNEAWHWRAFRAVLAPFGIGLTRAAYGARYLAFDDRAALLAMLGDGGQRPGATLHGVKRGGPRSIPSIETLLRRKRSEFRLLHGRRQRIGAATRRLIRALALRAPLAIVSGAALREIRAALLRAGLPGEFRTLVTAESVRRCKPDPEGYRLALRRVGLQDGSGSVAIEDSPGGIRAARAAGLTVLGVATTFSPARLRRAGAARVRKTLAEFTAEEILAAGRGRHTRRTPAG